VSTPAGAERPLRWDVVEEHLDEAGFLHAQWERALGDPEYHLAEVARGPEERLLAHLDALVVAGRRAAEKVLVPALGSDDPGVAFAAAWALLASEEGDFTEAVLDAFARGQPAQVSPLARAFMLAPRQDAFARLAPLLAGGSPAAQAGALHVLAHRRLDPGARLDPLLAAKDAGVRRAALRLARHAPERVGTPALEQALRSGDVEERDLALSAGLVLGVRAAWTVCEQVVRDGGPGWALPAVVYALSGEPDLAPLLAGLRDDARRGAALVALGYSGRAAAAEALLPWMEESVTARLAGEAFSAITGLALEGDHAAEPRAWDPDADEEDEPADGPEADLPLPEPGAVVGWWERSRGALDPAARHLAGKPWGADALAMALREGPMRRREALALDLAVRTRGAVQLEARDLARAQQAALAALGVPARVSAGPYAKLLGFSHSGGAAAPPEPPAGARPPRPPAPLATPPRAAASGGDGLVITALGMATAAGDGVDQGCAAARAGVLGLTELDGFQAWDEEAGEMVAVSGHAIPHLGGGFFGAARLARLGAAALREALAAAPGLDPQRTALLVAVPSHAALEAFERQEAARAAKEGEDPPEAQTRFRREQLAGRFLPALTRAAGLELPPAAQRLFAADGPGFAAALREAEAGIARGAWEACLVGGVDSLVEPAVLAALAGLNALRTPARAQGLVPGEGAGFVLVERAAAARRRGAAARARLGRVELAAAPPRFAPVERPGHALTQVVAAALAGGGAPAMVVASLNGDERRALDWGHARVRLQQRGLPGDTPECWPAEAFGDLGAAAGPVALCLAARSWERRAWSGPALMWLWGDAGEVAALGVAP
jgi:uncharacterized protein (TIGR02270 family)